MIFILNYVDWLCESMTGSVHSFLIHPMRTSAPSRSIKSEVFRQFSDGESGSRTKHKTPQKTRLKKRMADLRLNLAVPQDAHLPAPIR